MIVVADDSKRVSILGNFDLPVENFYSLNGREHEIDSLRYVQVKFR